MSSLMCLPSAENTFLQFKSIFTSFSYKQISSEKVQQRSNCNNHNIISNNNKTFSFWQNFLFSAERQQQKNENWKKKVLEKDQPTLKHLVCSKTLDWFESSWIWRHLWPSTLNRPGPSDGTWVQLKGLDGCRTHWSDSEFCSTCSISTVLYRSSGLCSGGPVSASQNTTEVFSSAFGQNVSIFSFFGSLNSSCSNIWKYIFIVFSIDLRIYFGPVCSSSLETGSENKHFENGETFSLWTSFSLF